MKASRFTSANPRKRFQIMIEQLLPQFRRQIGLRVVEKRRDVVLQCAFASALIVQEVRLPVAQHDVARLEIAIEKIIARRAQQELRQPAEIIFQSLFVERNAREPQKIIFEVVQVPGDRLPVETSSRIADLVIQIAAGLDLESRKRRDDFPVGLHDLRINRFAVAMFRQKLKERSVAKILFEIGSLIEILAVDLGNRQAVLAKVAGEFKEGGILFANAIQNADGACPFARQADDLAARSAKFSLYGLHPFDGELEMLLEESLENVHAMCHAVQRVTIHHQDITEGKRRRREGSSCETRRMAGA